MIADNNELYTSTCEPGIFPMTRVMNKVLPQETLLAKSLDAIGISYYYFILVTTSDSQIFGTDLILETVKPAKMIQNYQPAVRFRHENGYDSQHCFEPGGYAST